MLLPRTSDLLVAGPFPLTLDAINLNVDNKSGVYALLNARNEVLRVGRSFYDMHRRLPRYLTLSRYRDNPRYADVARFMFGYVRGKRAIFVAECVLFHAYDRPRLNVKHPDRPEGATYCCPIDKTCILRCSDADE